MATEQPNQTQEQLNRMIEGLRAEVRFTDELSFKLLGRTPLVAGIGSSIVNSSILSLTPAEAATFSVGAALVTFGLWQWDRRNMQRCTFLQKRLDDLENALANPDAHMPLDRREWSSVKKKAMLPTGRKRPRRKTKRTLRQRVRRCRLLLRAGKSEGLAIVYLSSMAIWLVCAALRVVA